MDYILSPVPTIEVDNLDLPNDIQEVLRMFRIEKRNMDNYLFVEVSVLGNEALTYISKQLADLIPNHKIVVFTKEINLKYLIPVEDKDCKYSIDESLL